MAFYLREGNLHRRRPGNSDSDRIDGLEEAPTITHQIHEPVRGKYGSALRIAL